MDRRKGIVTLTRVELMQVVLEKRKKAKEAKMGEGLLQLSQETFKLLLAVKSSGDISAEPARGQKIEEHVVTDLDLRNDENKPCLTSGAVAEER